MVSSGSTCGGGGSSSNSSRFYWKTANAAASFEFWEGFRSAIRSPHDCHRQQLFSTLYSVDWTQLHASCEVFPVNSNSKIRENDLSHASLSSPPGNGILARMSTAFVKEMRKKAPVRATMRLLESDWQKYDLHCTKSTNSTSFNRQPYSLWFPL